MTLTMSLVLVSPSTETLLKLLRTQSVRAAWRGACSMAQSVVTKQSMVAMSGWIMPEPLAIAPTLTLAPSMSSSTAASLGTVSVVMMASRARAPPLLESPALSAGIAFSIASMLILWPITPVDATITSVASRPQASAAKRAMALASARPCSPVQVLALPELTITALARPSARLSMVTRIGWPFTLFRV
jgi:hypothetical protein